MVDLRPVGHVLGLLLVALAALMLLPIIGTDFGKGAVRWFSFGFASVQPSEFLKPGFIILSAWLMAAAQDLNGPPGKLTKKSPELTRFDFSYLQLEREFLTNLTGSRKVMSIQVAVMTRYDERVFDNVKKHEFALRSGR